MDELLLIRLVGGGVQLGPLGTATTDCPIVPAPGDYLWWWVIRWNEDWQAKKKYSEKTYPSATLSTTNPTWPDPGLNRGRRGGKPATNRLSCGAALGRTYYHPGWRPKCTPSRQATNDLDPFWDLTPVSFSHQPWRWRNYRPTKRHWSSTALHGVIS
jgi:hypothetical protein